MSILYENHTTLFEKSSLIFSLLVGVTKEWQNYIIYNVLGHTKLV